ncbi:MAG: STAS domain-containing protein [Treponemataceae bacterium]|nr:STAS domain-containing protein [Treponemataceae bacterium]
MKLSKHSAQFNQRYPYTTLTITKAQDNHLTVSLGGELNMESTIELGNFGEILLGTLFSGTTIPLDLAGLHYISSTGVGSISQLVRQASRRDISVHIINCQPKVREVFQLLGLSSVLLAQLIAPIVLNRVQRFLAEYRTRQALEETQTKEYRLRTLIETVPMLMYTTTSDDRIVTMNHFGVQLPGFTKKKSSIIILLSCFIIPLIGNTNYAVMYHNGDSLLFKGTLCEKRHSPA